MNDKPTILTGRHTWIIVGCTCLLAAVLFVIGSSRRDQSSSQTLANAPNETSSRGRPSSGQYPKRDQSAAPIDSSTSLDSQLAERTPSAGRTSGPKPSPDGPEEKRASRRDSVSSTSGARKSLVDPMATWENLPPWPEGPRVFVEVETSNRRYVNLRPNDIGELPRIYTSAEERIELQVHFPEGTPGEKIFVEIPNGGSFPDLKEVGRVYQLPENLTLSFPYITDDAHGYCTLAIRHRGHTRSLPIWVGEPPESTPLDL